MPSSFDTLRCEIKSEDYEKIPYHTPILYSYHSHTRPTVEFFATLNEVQNWRNRLYFGVELESDTRSAVTSQRRNKLITISECCEIMQSNTYAYFMRDGSIDGGMELITQPSTYEFYKSNKDKFESVFNCIKTHGFLADKMHTTGFHVHFNRDFYSDNEEAYLANLLFAIDRYWPYLVYCSRRSADSISRWSQKYISKPEEIIDGMSHGMLPERYHALNIRNRDTFEFRLWHGTLDIHTFYAILTLVNNLVIMAKSKTKEEIAKTPFEFLITSKELAKYWIDVSRRQVARKYDEFLKQ